MRGITGLIAAVSAKGIKQQKAEDRVKYDRAVLKHGDGESFDYYEWDALINLDNEQQQTLLRKLHERIDNDSDGFIAREELIVWSLRAMFNINGHDAEDDWELVEFENNGDEMSFQDVIHSLYDWRFEGNANVFEIQQFDPNDVKFFDYNRLYNRDKARFTGADLNGNGLLSKSEWVLFNNPMKDDDVYNAVIEEALGLVDTDQDGKLTLTEYMADWHAKPITISEVRTKIEVSQFKNDMDRDGNGFLEKDELIFWIHPDNSYNAIDEAEHLLTMCDQDGDDKLTAHEITEETSLWLKSDATEHGQTLRHLEL